jgi:hypothetical protein
MSIETDVRTMSDEQLLAQCRFEAFRGPGPGGQKRNKTSSAVRLTHRPSGLSAEAAELRSQHQNRNKALARLRHRLVLELRQTIDPSRFVRPAWLEQVLREQGSLRVTPRSDHYPAAMGLVLDVLAATGWRIAQAAHLLGLSTAHLVKFLQNDNKLLAKVNQMRPAAGMKTLGARP